MFISYLNVLLNRLFSLSPLATCPLLNSTPPLFVVRSLGKWTPSVGSPEASVRVRRITTV